MKVSTLLVALAAIALAGCDRDDSVNSVRVVIPKSVPENGVASLYTGQFVRHRVSGRRGQIIEVYPVGSTVDVRFAGPFEIINMFTFEVEADKR